MTTTKKKPKFSKDVLLNSKRFKDKKDLVSAVLKDGVEYTISDAERTIRDYLKGKVKN